jgi:DNA repair photolyase
MIKINIVSVGSLLNATKIPAADFAINPYTGCTHACAYCYAEFMRRFSGHAGEGWGEFIDVKRPRGTISLKKIAGKSVSVGTVTDPYNPLEAKYMVTRRALEELRGADTRVLVVTKSDLVTRDAGLLAGFKDLIVAFSVASEDEKFRRVMEPGAPSFERRFEAMRRLRAGGVRTALFISPIFPGITDFKRLIARTRDFTNQYWFENLNLRAGYKTRVLGLIERDYPSLSPLYKQIYVRRDRVFWRDLSEEIEDYCRGAGLGYINYFYHEWIRRG